MTVMVSKSVLSKMKADLAAKKKRLDKVAKEVKQMELALKSVKLIK